MELSRVLGHNRVHIDANEDANVRNFFEIWTKHKVAEGPQIANEGVEPFDVSIVLEYALEFLEECLLAVVGEETSGHGGGY